MPPIFLCHGYLLAVASLCSVWVYAIAFAGIQLFAHPDATAITICGLAALGAASFLGFAMFVKLAETVSAGAAVYVGRAICGCCAFLWPFVMPGANRQAPALLTLLLTLGGLVALHRTLRRMEGNKIAAMATGASLIASTCALPWVLPFFAGMAACCGALSYRVVGIWFNRKTAAAANLNELFLTVALIAVPLGLTASVLRAAHPLYTKYAVMQPLDQWNGSLEVDLWYFDVWIEYPKSSLSAEDRKWFSRRQHDGHFFERLVAGLRPTVRVEGKAEQSLNRNFTLASDSGEWLGESLDSVHAGKEHKSRIYLEREAAMELGRLGARIVVDDVHNARSKGTR